ncbi:red pigment-concentrating hormone [Cherax quadricarinatus]
MDHSLCRQHPAWSSNRQHRLQSLRYHTLTQSPRMVRGSVALLLVVLVASSCVSAQLNFSPGWGKRTGTAAGGPDQTILHSSSPAAVASDNCGTIPVSAVMHIYRLIRTEAARLVQCQEEEYMG